MKRIHGLFPVTLATIVLTAAVCTASMEGLWYGSIAAGIVIGLLMRAASVAVLSGIIAGIAGWGLPLWWQTQTIHVRHTANVVAQIMGFGSYGVIVIALTLILGLLFTLSGVWVARSVVMVFQRPIHAAHKNELPM